MEKPEAQNGILRKATAQELTMEIPKSQKWYFEESNHTELTMEKPKSILGKATVHGANHGET